MAIVSQQKLFDEAVTALAAYVAVGIVTNAHDNDEDPATYSTDPEVIELYTKELFGAVSKKLPDVVKYLASLPAGSVE